MDPYSLYPDPAKNLNPDPCSFLTLPGIYIELFYNYKFLSPKKVNVIKALVF